MLNLNRLKRRFRRPLMNLWLLGGLALSSASAAQTFTLDIDADGRTDPLTDGLLVLRQLFGFSGDALTEGAVGAAALRVNPDDIQQILEANVAQLDIDGDGQAAPLTDGLLILRYLFGFSGESLIQGAVGVGATRSESELVIASLEGIIDTDGDGTVDRDEDRPPVLTLTGDALVTVIVNEVYLDPGAVAQDSEDGDLTRSIKVVGLDEIDTSEIGTYTIVYSITDSAGNVKEVERIVAVNPDVEVLTVLAAKAVAADPKALLGEDFNIIGAFDAAINYSSCENDGGQGCPSITWETVVDDDRGEVLQVTHGAAGDHAGLYLKTGQGLTLDLSRFTRGKILFDVKVISGDPKMTMKIDCVFPCTSNDYALADASPGVWVTYEVDVDALVTKGLELRAIDTGLVIWATQHKNTVFQIDQVRWQANPDGPGDGLVVINPPGFDWKLPEAEAGYQAPTDYDGYRLYWKDDFSDVSINTDNWNFEVNGNGGGNNELQFYRAENAYVREGLLVIEAREEAFAGKRYTSARLTTQDKIEFQYGRIDIRALLPTGQGLWPALWMLGANFPEVGWPRSGEIDIMELLGQRDNNAFGTVHWSNDGNKAQYPNGPSGVTLQGDETFHNQFHVFSLIWQETELEWLIDGVSFLKFSITDASGLDAFRKAFFLIFNVAVGGNLPGPPNNSTAFPQYMHVDYVRVYQVAGPE